MGVGVAQYSSDREMGGCRDKLVYQGYDRAGDEMGMGMCDAG